ncbi:Helix-turn-helix domain containing protein, type 11 [Ketogulonicigenium robustum]|uniref:Helix-turn-helix domain containing protein, type 11 n=1 Tax=Ketogulonicigenium robustum TaxID=92947 RepID=A0A1W6P0Q2_9RHOB|nr:HTH domain-containing protein [Ketogulonicigenium robustum]ARO14981.1 Helix-turn-helix domain containing protein, type 11 [Ketogulonicigenium robustum]
MESPKNERLFAILQRLRTLAPAAPAVTAQALATENRVTLRTIYRDIAALIASGVPVRGTPGQGYRVDSGHVTLPPMNLSLAEVEALHIGLTILGEADDPALRSAARGLSAKIDAALAADLRDADRGWALAGPGITAPVAGDAPDAARGFHDLPLLRSAIARRQKVAITTAAASPPAIVRPLRIDYWGRIWTLTCWSETEARQINLRTDHILTIRILPQLFSPENTPIT